MGFDQILTNTLKNEGGFTVDQGGRTNYGVTQKTYDGVAKELGLEHKDVTQLKYGDVRKVYESEFWKKPGISNLPSEKIQGIMFDWGVNSGTTTPIKKLQEIVGATPDGKMGKKTIAAVNKYIEIYGEDSLAFDVMNARLNFNQSLITKNPTKYGASEKGWDNRLNNVADQNNLG
jgi:lysozyme family protein